MKYDLTDILNQFILLSVACFKNLFCKGASATFLRYLLNYVGFIRKM